MKTFLYVAEDIQQRADGKMVAVGLFADQVVVVNSVERPTKERPTGANLSLLVCVGDLQAGSYVVKLVVMAPDGAPTKFAGETRHEVATGASIITGLQCQPFAFSEYGRYTLRATVNRDVFEHPFELREGNPS
jgi:hypothetical protein